MPVPTLITDLDPVAGNNSPASSESPKDGDDYIRALSAFIAQLNNTVKGVAGTFRGLDGSSTGGTKTASWTADELIAETSLVGEAYRGTSLSLSFNGATTGANGMDTGATPTSADLYIYAIYNPTTATWATLGTTAGSGAVVYGGANMPSGYTASCLLWSGKTTASGQFVAFVQCDRDVSIESVLAFSGGTATTYTSISLSSIVPLNAKTVGGYYTNPTGVVNVASSSAGVGQLETQCATYGSMSAFVRVILAPAQTIYYKVLGGTGAFVYLSSYSI